MIRECFKTGTGIVFDAHMLENEVGLDIGPNLEVAPKALSPEPPRLARADTAELDALSMRQIPIAIIYTLGSPLIWIWNRMPHVRSPSKAPPAHDCLKSQKSKGEAREELNDALCPIYDQLEKYTHWKVMEWLPCKLPRSPNLSASAA